MVFSMYSAPRGGQFPINSSGTDYCGGPTFATRCDFEPLRCRHTDATSRGSLLKTGKIQQNAECRGTGDRDVIKSFLGLVRLSRAKKYPWSVAPYGSCTGKPDITCNRQKGTFHVGEGYFSHVWSDFKPIIHRDCMITTE